MIEQRFVERIAEAVGAQPWQAAVAVQLLDKGATVPFVAAYRKDLTGALSESQLEQIEQLNVEYTAFINRRNAVLQNIAKRKMLTEHLREEIMTCTETAELEDVYLPFRRQRRTRATVAREQGLGALADYIWEQPADNTPLSEVAGGFIDSARQVSSPEEALEGARAILVERINFDRATRGAIRTRLRDSGHVTTSPTRTAEGHKTKFESYYQFSELLKEIPSHRLLAAMRGVKQGFLRLELAIDDAALLTDLLAHYLKSDREDTREQIQLAVEEAYNRHLRPTLEEEVIAASRAQAENEAIHVFQENARNLLLSPPAGPIPVMGIEPAGTNGATMAIIDEHGHFLGSHVFSPEKEPEAAEKTLTALLEEHKVKAVAIGNGTGAREVARFVNRIIRQSGNNQVFSIFVNESGAAIYSVSKDARDEMPEAEMSARSAVSIARRLQDPLAELVKIEPRNIGVGQYQHDVNQRQLRDGLFKTIVSCVNRVGVDLNKADVSILRYVSGIQMGTAQHIVAHRGAHGNFLSRNQLIEVDGIGPKTHEQCAGFMRIVGGDEPLDATFIHPEAYPVVNNMASDLGVAVKDLLRNRELIEKLDFSKYAFDVFGPLTLADIRNELLRPGRDPRRRFKPPKFLEGVFSIEELQEGVETEGIVTNVTDFGAFIDIGVQQDGLVHLSELANRYVADPRQLVKVGDIVRVKVISVDRAAPRISLSMRAVAAKPKRRRGARRGRPEDAPAQTEGAAVEAAAAAPPDQQSASAR